MSWFGVIYLAFSVTTFFVSAAIALYSRRRRDVPGASAFMWLCVLICLLILFEGLSMIGPTKDGAFFWFRLRFIALAFAPVVWLIFVLQYTGKSQWLKPWMAVALMTIPTATQAMIWTNSYHWLWVKQPVDFYRPGLFWIVQTGARLPGVWTWVHMAYSYSLMVAGSIVLIVMSARLYRQQRKGVIAVIAGMMVMTVGSVYPLLIPVSLHQFNPLTSGFAVGIILIAWGMYRFEFLRAAPVFESVRRFPVIMTVLFILMIAGIFMAGFIYFRHFEKNYRAGAERQLLSILNLKINEIEHWRRERMGDAAVFHQNTVFAKSFRRLAEDRTDLRAKKEVSVWLEKFRLSYEYKNILAYDASGVLLASARPFSEPACREILRVSSEAFKSGKIIFLDFHRLASEGAIHLALLVPINDAGKSIGVVVMMIDPDRYLYPLIQQWPTESKTAETLLVRPDGGDVLFLNELRFHRNAALNLRIPLNKSELPAARAVKGEEGIFEGIDYRGIPVAAAVARVPDSPWFMIARVDLSEINEPLQSYFWLMIILIGSLVTATIAVVWVLWLRQTREAYLREAKAAEAIKASEEKFRKAFMTSPDAVALMRWRDGLLVSVNPGFFEITGYKAEDTWGKKMPDLPLWQDHGARRKLVEKLMLQGTVMNEEMTLYRKSGDLFYGLLSASLLDLSGETYLLSIIRDITERKQVEKKLVRTNRILALMSRINRMLIHTHDRDALFAEACRIAVEYGQFRMAWIGLVDEIHQVVAPCKWYGAEDGYLAQIEPISTSNVPEGNGPTGMVVRDGRYYYSNDIADDPLMAPWRDHALQRGYRSSIAMPIRLQHKVIGAFNIYAGEAFYFDEAEINLLNEVTGNINYALEILELEKERLGAEQHIRLLNEELEQRVARRTAELLAKTAELERINKVFVDRELRMRELKGKIALLEKIGTKESNGQTFGPEKPQV